MKRCVSSLLIVLSTICIAFSQEDYAISKIPDSLLTGSSAVIRKYETELERSSVGKYKESVRYIITILTKEGFGKAALDIHYDGSSKVTSHKGIVYDQFGKVIKKIKKKDFNDFAANNSYTLYSDHRLKRYIPVVNKLPFTIEYEYVIEHNGLVGFNTWIPHRNYNNAVQAASLKISTPKDLQIRFKELNGIHNPQNSSVGENMQYYWQVENLGSIDYESKSPIFLEIFPAILLSANQIYFDGYKGDYSTWNSYGNWCSQLLESRDILPNETIEAIRKETRGIEDDRLRVKRVYEFMQEKTRYVNIALGIGGFQPKSAYDVDQKGYGDCKALSNYTKALLKEIGIKSHYAEIGNGPNQKILYPDFASANQTNHVILCVPFEQDTIWLECTNQQIPFGYIGRGNANRYALLVTDDGGILAKTPKINAEDNVRSIMTKAIIDVNGNAKVVADADYYHHMFEEVFPFIHESKKDQLQLITNLLSGSYKIDNLNISDYSNSKPHGNLIVEGVFKKYAKKVGDRFIIQPNYLFKNQIEEIDLENREQDVDIEIGYTYQDTLLIQIPDNYVFSTIPDEHINSTEFGSFSIEYSRKSNALQIIRKLTIQQGRYRKNHFQEISMFINDINKKDREKLVLKLNRS